jgi:hypothetical protein
MRSRCLFLSAAALLLGCAAVAQSVTAELVRFEAGDWDNLITTESGPTGRAGEVATEATGDSNVVPLPSQLWPGVAVLVGAIAMSRRRWRTTLV